MYICIPKYASQRRRELFYIIYNQIVMMQIENLDELIKLALREDIGDGDHSTLACIPPTARDVAKMVAKADGILCGAEVGERVFKLVDASLTVTELPAVRGRSATATLSSRATSS